MKESSIVITVLIASWMNVQGQSVTSSNVVGTVPGKQIDIKSGTRSIITELPVKKGEPEGDVYLNSDWALADLTLSNNADILKGLPVKLNLQRVEFEINVNNQIKVLPGSRVREFLLLQTNGLKKKYVNGNAYKLNGAAVDGFLHRIETNIAEQKLNTSPWQLFVRQQLTIIASNYNAALDMGNRSDRFVKTESILLEKGGVLYETKAAKKNFVKIFTGNEETVRKFIKEKKINPKKREDLIILVMFLNDNQI